MRPPCPLLNLIGPVLNESRLEQPDGKGVFMVPIYYAASVFTLQANKTEMIMKSSDILSGLDEGAVDL